MRNIIKENAVGCQSRCYEPGGPWIQEDPNCPIHGYEAQRAEREREQERQEREEREEDLAEQLEETNSRLEALERAFEQLQSKVSLNWVKVKDNPPVPGLIVKRFKNGTIWAGQYNGTEKESSFVEYIQLPE